MIQYIHELPPPPRDDLLPQYLSTFHNAVTIRTGRGTTLVYGDHWATVTEFPQEAFLDYLLAVAFVVGTDHPNFQPLLLLGMPSVGLTPPQKSSDWKDPCALYKFLRKEGHVTRTFQRILDEFVPPDIQPSFPCSIVPSSSSVVSFSPMLPLLILKTLVILLAWSVLGYKWRSRENEKKNN
jgi:hypothetical protein